MRAFPGFRARVEGAKLIAEGAIQPSSLSATYRVRIDYIAGSPPEVRVLDPPLALRPGADRIPHTYEQERLCLYLPGSGEWSPDLPLAHVVIPWISLWLLNYELWHATGEWLGGGVEPNIEGPYIREKKTRSYESARS